jgi:phosphoribosylaminoimidazole (AIR) synthetase
MIVCVAPQDVDPSLQFLRQQGEAAWRIGQIEAGAPGTAPHVVIR